MLKLIRPEVPKRISTLLSQCSCNFADKADIKESVPEPPEDEKHSKNKENDKALQKTHSSNEVTKQDLEWRTPSHEKNVQYYGMLRTFYSQDSNASLLKWMQQPIDFSPSKIKKWWLGKKEVHETILQQYIPERHQILGAELACAHFLVHRGGAVKFHHEDKWIKASGGSYELPRRYQKGMYLQAIDCADTNLKYEGLDNLRGLRNVEWLSLNGCISIDDFCLDVITNIFSHSLRYLDLRNCFNITERGLGALYKMPHLRILYLDDMLKDTRYEMTCLLLEELNPGLHIKSDVITFEVK